MVIIIDDEFYEQMDTLRAYAEAHPISIDHQLDVNNKEALPAVDHAEYTLEIQRMKIVFSHDEHPMGHIRHLSVSHGKDGRLPDPFSVTVIMERLGFTVPIQQCKVWLEYIAHNHQAVNVAELIPSNQ